MFLGAAYAVLLTSIDPQAFVTALFAFFNRVADAFGLEDPNYFDQPPPRGGDPIEPGPTS